MGVEQMIAQLGQVGFPIVVTSYLLVSIGKTQAEQNKILTELSVLIKGLCDRMENIK